MVHFTGMCDQSQIGLLFISHKMFQGFLTPSGDEFQSWKQLLKLSQFTGVTFMITKVPSKVNCIVLFSDLEFYIICRRKMFCATCVLDRFHRRDHDLGTQEISVQFSRSEKYRIW
jgi:hypothetical protein